VKVLAFFLRAFACMLALACPGAQAGWSPGDFIEVCNRNPSQDVGWYFYVYTPIGRQGYRDGWFLIEPGKCGFVDLSDFDNDVALLVHAETREGQWIHPQRDRSGGARLCAPADRAKNPTWKDISPLPETVDSCGSGEALLYFPFYEYIRWAAYSQQYGFRRPRVDLEWSTANLRKPVRMLKK
jgi:hypothetical protein